MELDDIQLETGLDGLRELLDRERPGPQFGLSSNQFLFQKAKKQDAAARRGIKELIKAENARVVLAHLPGPDERTHCLLRGDFVLCDLIPAIIEARGRCRRLDVATLGLSAANADTLASLRARNLVDEITLVCSHYFAQVDKTSTYRQVTTKLEGKATIRVTRSHAKVICLQTVCGDYYVIEGSANLRSSDNVEQMVIFNDEALLRWHRAWMEDVR